MKKIIISLGMMAAVWAFCLDANGRNPNRQEAQAEEWQWRGKRITSSKCQNASNTWMKFETSITLTEIPAIVKAAIACDTKYWLWINGERAVFEGGLKRGPTPEDSYYDVVDIAPFLMKGENKIEVLTWFFGKEGFSHKSSGVAGLVFDCPGIGLFSDKSWKSTLETAYENTPSDNPNYRLPESNIRYNATIEKGITGSTLEIGAAESAPWNKLYPRPIPLFKDYGVREYENRPTNDSKTAAKRIEGTEEWIECKLPYNCHVTPILDIDSEEEGKLIKIQTDNYDYLGQDGISVRAEYVTKAGRQSYESLGWMNGHTVRYMIPKGVTINSLSYRETGYDCDFTGKFSCSDPFFEKLWAKAERTLYVTMRDTYMDCPDRERAQWWGDAVNESGEAFYALSSSAADLTKKGMLELVSWQRPDGVLYSPVPSGNWYKELPGQMLASVGYYGFWNYYLNTGDKLTIEKVIDGVRSYLDVWKLKPDGTLEERHGDWYWGDWGKLQDKQLLFNAWYYLALKGYGNMAKVTLRREEAEWAESAMKAFREAFNKAFWDGNGYRTKDYEGSYDDRAQALAVVGGLADKEKYPQLEKVFETSFLASPYMEKYVIEAMYMMGEQEKGLERMKRRYDNMINDSPFTTLYENFGQGNDENDYGTRNHAWSGGGLTILAQYVCGISPLEPGWKKILIRPALSGLTFVSTENVTVAGKYAISIRREGKSFNMNLEIPSEGVLCVDTKSVRIDGKKERYLKKDGNDYIFSVSKGKHTIVY
ncbi:MAG: alpha-L-rhamnosidase C-terminal domain-containing protein [Bacteroidales bacterium]